MPASITCPVCGLTSHNPNDVTQGYCGHCHDYTGAIPELVNALPYDTVAAGMYWDRQGMPLSFARWTWLYEGNYHRDHPAFGYKRLAQDELPDGIRVSTIWEGIATWPAEFGPAQVFETMVFLDGEPTYQERYTTEAEAIATHRTLVKSLELVGRSFLDELAAEDA